MLLDTDDLADLLDRLAEQRGRRVRFDRSVLLAAVAEAEQLAGEHAKDEPAALFFALTRRSRGFSPVAETFVASAVRAQAIALGYELVVDGVELTILRAAIPREQIAFAHVRAWIAGRLRPVLR